MDANKKDPFDGEYIGNIWGWKISYLSLALILVMLLFMWYRYANLTEEDLERYEEKIHLQEEQSEQKLNTIKLNRLLG